jgi:DNA modification methylase
VNDHNKYGKQFKDDMPMQQYFEWQRDCIEQMLRVCKGIVFYNIQMLTGNKVALCQLLGHFSDKVKEIIIWDKINAEPAMHEGILNSMFEFIIVFDKNNAIARQFDVFNAERGTLANVLRIHKNTERQNINHNAVFPTLLPRHLIHYFSPMGGVILDPFIGSGTTAVAAIKEGRHYIGFELNKEYFDIACKRIKNEQAQLTLF